MIGLRSNINEGGPGGHGWEAPTGLRFEDLLFLVDLAVAPFLGILVDGGGGIICDSKKAWLAVAGGDVSTLWEQSGRRSGILG